MIRPEVTKLYKYRSYSDQALQMLENNQVFLAAPVSFNDPFDCAIRPVIDVEDGDELIELTAKRFEFFGFDKEETKSRLKAFSGAKSEHIRVICRKFREIEIHTNLNGLGVLSLSEINDHPLMWAHYANRHTGFCIEYKRTPTNDLADAKPVNYSPEYPIVNLFKMNPHQQSELSVFTKDIHWGYEKEWRRVISEPNTIKEHHPTMMSAIIFGARMKHNHKTWIRSKVANKPHIMFYQASLKDGEYGIEINPV